MKFTSSAAAIALLAAPMAQALPRTNMPQISGHPIRDVERLAELEALHNTTLSKLMEGDYQPVARRAGSAAGENNLDKRVTLILGVSGMVLVEVAKEVAPFLGEIANSIAGAVGDMKDQVWHDETKCRTYFQTHAGGEEEIRTYNRGSSGATATHNLNAGWVDPENNAPPVHYFKDDQGMGEYSVQFTATDSHAWGGIEGTTKCSIQGLCHPQYIFYRDGYNIVLDTWKSEGRVSACQYSGGEDCAGLCAFGVKDQFSNNGVKWGGDCAVPCADQGGLPDSSVESK
ncbi:uncharacterized protein B0I36DRAFT_274027 [Microdochium trichocladiopsis]|uniref:Uncharacterized protein n=1 Tax=Microdochium trichocladiopsis TaxID=1682393 RepID=A0A9P9BLK1_9PEZI|nr:uncharacterized protein B0I36DRAFT_274027 [Microdochium trichocladiopsis]KAH7024475.1 hypothetical protein B0I36DRAFT_274027 [Microdochium trichocladiopsis]